MGELAGGEETVGTVTFDMGVGAVSLNIEEVRVGREQAGEVILDMKKTGGGGEQVGAKQ